MKDPVFLNDPVLMIFAKYPTPGRCKTRLAKVIGDRAAAELATAFLRDSVRRFETVDGTEVRVFGDTEKADTFVELLGHCRFEPQGGGDLGARMRRSFARLFSEGRPGIALGADTPGLPLTRVAQACATVRRGEVALGPSVDGGYYLLGLPRPFDGWERLFDGLDWGRRTVLGQTRDVLRSCGVAWTELEPARDIDEWRDLVQWVEEQEAGGSQGRQAVETLPLARALVRRGPD